MRKVGLLAIAVALVSAMFASSLNARPPYNKEWIAKYVEGSKSEDFKKAAMDAKCNVCHLGTDKKMRNDYGKALSKLLKNEKDVEKIKKVIEEVSKEKAKDGKTFAEKIEAGVLPGAE